MVSLSLQWLACNVKACSLIDYLEGYTTYDSYRISGGGTAVSFTTSAGDSMSSNTYQQDYCDCEDESAFLNEAAKLCTEDSDCIAMTYYPAEDSNVN